MLKDRNEFLRLASVKQSNFKVPSLKDYEITMRELTIAEAKEFGEIAKDKSFQEAIVFACRCTCVEPEFFTDEELKTLGATGSNAIMEIYSEIPLIGKTKDEREEYMQKLLDTSKVEKKEDAQKVDEKKPSKKSVNSSSN